jgi:vesicle-associated membrane protein 7
MTPIGSFPIWKFQCYIQSKMSQIIFGLIFIDGENKGDYSTDSKGSVLRDTIVDKIIPKLAPHDHRRTLTQKDLEFHYNRSGNTTVFCVAHKDVKKRTVWNFIDETQQRLTALGPKAKNSACKAVLKELILKWNDPKNDKIDQLNSLIDETKAKMVDNIDTLIEREVKLQDLVRDTEALETGAGQFKVTAKKVKNAMLLRLIFLIILLVFVVLAVILIALFAGCGFPYFDRCGGSSLPGRSPSGPGPGPTPNVTSIAWGGY